MRASARSMPAVFRTELSGSLGRSAAAGHPSRQVRGCRTDCPPRSLREVHIMIFMLMLVLLFQAAASLWATREIAECWAKYSR
ncbi:unnamed protein product, partial [Prorocentrum cordatum]